MKNAFRVLKKPYMMRFIMSPCITMYHIELMFYFGGERGIWTLGTAVAVHMISNHAPSATRTPLHALHIVALYEVFTVLSGSTPNV